MSRCEQGVIASACSAVQGGLEQRVRTTSGCTRHIGLLIPTLVQLFWCLGAQGLTSALREVDEEISVMRECMGRGAYALREATNALRAAMDADNTDKLHVVERADQVRRCV